MAFGADRLLQARPMIDSDVKTREPEMKKVETRRLGRTGIAGSALGFGASEFGQKRIALKSAAAILGRALDAGLNVIDTAACYGNSEELIGRAV